MTIKDFANKYDLSYGAVASHVYGLPYRLIAGSKARDYEEKDIYDAIQHDTRLSYRDTEERASMLRERMDRIEKIFEGTHSQGAT